ncbi:MAG: ribose 1,5-bisphosphate isomerase [Candidatus Bathyarchaeia archaeon]
MDTEKRLNRIAADIQAMRIRGAGRIARSAILALQAVAEGSRARDEETFIEEMNAAVNRLLSTRPTAVSLANSVRYLMNRVKSARREGADLERLRSVVVAAAEDFIKESRQAVERIGEIGSRRIRSGDVLLTHCQSDAAAAVMKRAWIDGKQFSVYVTETRPRFQGRKTAALLAREGIPVTVIVDSAARYFMNEVDKVIVGADVISANGALVNKIGTASIASLAHESRTQFIVASETYKFSPETAIGELVTIEERDATEILPKSFLKKYPKISVRNPSFDVTPPEYIDLIVTEKGIIPPQGAIMIIHEMFGTIQPSEILEYQTYRIDEE